MAAVRRTGDRGAAGPVTALAPATALAWLASLSVDLRGAAVLDEGGEPLAGDAALAARGRSALAAAPVAAEVHDRDLLAVRSARRAIVASVGPQALIALHLADLRAALQALDAD
jgi:hypothetical protein